MTAAPETTKGRGSRRKLTTSDYQALGAFRHALRKFLAFSEAGSDAMGLTPQQHQALLAVRGHTGTEAMTVGELAERLLIRNHSALGLAERLIEKGLMTRAPSPQDRRRVLLYLTVDGARQLERISRRNLGQLKSALPVFTELLRALEHLELPPPSDESVGTRRRPKTVR
ncbi:MAG TPA: MarR family transcriptional regulator [Phenylobacterium sp.]